MKGRRRMSLIHRFFARRSEPVQALPEDAAGHELKGAALEQAYRDLILENQLLVDGNQRLHQRIAQIEAGLSESPAAKQLIRAQRNALAERSSQLREVRYENLNLKREQKRMHAENRKLAASLARHMQDIQPLLHKEELSRRELEEAKAALREKSNELAKLTDKYYQLEARSIARPPPSSAANSRY